MNVIKELWAKAGSVTVPDGVTIPFWGFAPAPDGEPQLPGPTIEAKVGDNVQITLYNTLGEPVSIIFQGQEITPVPVKDEKNIYVSFTRHADPNGGTVTYSFRARRPGTYLYESGTFPERQVQMGLHGVLIIRPAEYISPVSSTRTAYGMGTGTEFDVEKIIVTSELDSSLHGKIAAGLPYDMHNFDPDYFTINGRAYPDTLNPDNLSSQPYSAAVKTIVGNRIILRCANAGFLTHSLYIGGGFFRVVAGDGTPLKTPLLDTSYEKTAITIGPGQTYDLIYKAVSDGEIYLYDRELRYTVNAGRFPGGIMTSIKLATAPPTAPSNLAASAMSATEVRLTWTDNSGGDSSFMIERRMGNGGAFTLIATVSAGTTSYTDTSLKENTPYSYRVRAYNDYGLSGYSNTALVRTPVRPPLAPSNLEARRISDNYVLLTWTDNSNNATVFSIERRSQNETEFFEVARVPLKNTQYFDKAPTGKTYYYRVRAQNGGGSSDYSNVALV